MEVLVLSRKDANLSLKKAALSIIREILVSEYKIPASNASALIKLSGVEEAFNKDAELAGHTSYKTWAQRAYDYHRTRFKTVKPSSEVQLRAYYKIAPRKFKRKRTVSE